MGQISTQHEQNGASSNTSQDDRAYQWSCTWSGQGCLILCS